MSNLKVLTCQKVISGQTWDHLKSHPDDLERYIKREARHYIAAEIADKTLSHEVLTEPDPASKDPMRQTNAVLRLSVAVAAKEDAARLALDLAEAEERGFRAALQAVKSSVEEFVPRMGPTAYAHSAIEAMVHRVQEQRDHRPAADWRPMRSCDSWSGVEYLFANGEIGREPRRRVYLPVDLPTALTLCEPAATVDTEELLAIAWRYAGRPPHVEARR